VADFGNDRIQKFDSNGNFLTKWGTLGAGDMELYYPGGITVSDSGDVYVADSGNHCIKVYRPVGGSAVEPANKQLATWGGMKRTALYQNYPNPFNPDTWIPFSLSKSEDVKIRIYSSTGQLVRTLSLGLKNAGDYLNKEKAACWDGRNSKGEEVSSCVYFYVMEAGSFRATKKMVILK
jgi:hypothetical protein